MKTLLALLTVVLTFAVFAPQAEAGDRRYRSYDNCDRQVYYGRPVYYQQPVYYNVRPRTYYSNRSYRSYYDDDRYYSRRPSSRFSISFSR